MPWTRVAQRLQGRQFLGCLLHVMQNCHQTLRIPSTSQPLVAIQEALNATQHVYTRSLDNVDASIIRFYVSTRLESLDGTFSYDNS